MTVDFERLTWQDYPSKATPINAENLNRIEEAIAGIYRDVEKSVLYLTNVPVFARTGDIATVSNSNITANHVVAACSFSDTNSVTTDVTWTTSNGQLVLNGTCKSATTAAIMLISSFV